MTRRRKIDAANAMPAELLAIAEDAALPAITPEVGYPEVRAAVNALVEAGGRDSVLEIFDALGVRHGTELTEDQWPHALRLLADGLQAANRTFIKTDAHRRAHLAQEVANCLPKQAATEGGIAAVSMRVAEIGAQDPIEEMLASQLVGTHNVMIDCTKRALRAEFAETRRDEINFASKMSRTFAALVEALDRHRRGGEQKMTVEHVHVHAGGQAIVGTIEAGGRGQLPKSGGQSGGA